MFFGLKTMLMAKILHKALDMVSLKLYCELQTAPRKHQMILSALRKM